MTSENDRTDASGSLPPENPGNPTDGGFRAFQPGERQRSRRGPLVPGAAIKPPGQLPSNPPSGEAPTAPTVPLPTPDVATWPRWRNADRAPRWAALPPPDLGRLQQSQLVTFLAVPLWPLGLHGLWFAAMYFWARFATAVLGWRMGVPSYRSPVPGLFGALTTWVQSMRSLPDWLLNLAQVGDVLVLSALTFLAAPFFLTFVLKQVYRLQPLSIARLGQVSPEAQRQIQGETKPPQFGLLPTTAPIAFTYGTSAKNARIVLSQGLLDQLTDAEIATICVAEARSIHPLNMGLITWILAVLQVPYLVYALAAQLADQLAAWGTKQSQRWLEILVTIGVYALAIVAAIGHISFTTLRWMGLWFTRQRSIGGDHAAVNRTGNPNAQARALLKIAYGISQDMQTQGQTDFALEGFELAMPVGYRQAATLGSLLGVMSAESALAWDWGNPQRHYFSFNNSQALLGGRLARLMQTAQQWQLPTELDMREYPAAKSPQPTWPQLVTAAWPFWGAAIGYAIAVAFWAIAWISFWFGWRQLAWLGSDFRLMYALPLIGFGIGSLIRFNQYFPDLPNAWLRRSPEAVGDLAMIVQDPLALPQRAAPIALTGKLLGRSGVGNWLCQDLWLQNEAKVLVRLHYPSPLGWLSNLGWVDNRVNDLRGQMVSAMGWLRRGATPWMDVERLRNDYGKTRWGAHQVWSTIVLVAAVLIGIMWLGGFEDLMAYIRRVQLPRR
jgi:Zn-dependent protease with chaperone function